jgi:hypothetical protein
VSDAVEYRPVPDFPGYWVSSDGKCWTTRYKESTWDEGRRGFRWVEGEEKRLMYHYLNRYGYLECKLCKGGKVHKRRVHVLVCTVFKGERPKGKLACHNNGDSIDNRVENLDWKTPKQNSEDMVKHGTSQTGVKNYNAKLSESAVRRAFDLRRELKLLKEISKEIGVTEQTVCRILRGELWGHLGLKL